MREEKVSVSLSPPSRREEEAEADEESPVLRRHSPGYLGMGEVETSCFWDPKLENESMCELLIPFGNMEGEKENLGSVYSSDGREIGGRMLLGGRVCEDFEAQLNSEKVGVSMDANGGVNDQTLEVEKTEVQKFCSSTCDSNGVSFDFGNDSGEFVMGVLGVEEENGRSGLEQALSVEVPKMLTEEGHEEFSDLSPFETLGGDDTLEVEVTEEVQRSCFSPLDDNGGAVDIGNGSGEVVLGRKEAEKECHGVLVLEEESGVEAPRPVTEEEHDELPGLLPLRTLGGDGLGCLSGIGIGMEVGYIGGVFDNDRVCNGCEDELPVSSGMAADCPSMKISGPCCLPPLSGECMAASETCKAISMEERCEKLLLLEPEKVNCGLCSGNEPCLNDGSGEENEFSLRTSQGLSLEHMGVQKRHSEANVNGPSEEISTCHQEVVEEDRCQSSHVEGEVASSVQGSPNEVASCSATEGLASQQPPHLSTSVENWSLNLSLAPDFQGSEVDAVNGTSACCSNVNSSGGEADNGGKVDIKSSSIIVFRRTNPKRAASLRSSLADGKSDQLTRTRNNGRKCKKAVDTGTSFSLSTIKISNKSKRKRSSSHRPARLSVWGPVENLIKIFEQNGELGSYGSNTFHIQNKRSKKGRSRVGRKKRQMAQKVGIFQVSSAKHDASSDQPMFHVVVGSQTSDCMPASDCQIDLGISDQVEAKYKLVGDGCAVGVRSLQQDGQLGDKDLESTLTQETSVDNMLGECPGVSSRIGPEIFVETVNDRNLLDPGTSPDSDVYHPIIDVGIMTNEGATSTNQVIGTVDVGIMTSGGATSTNQVIGKGQSVLVLEPVAEDGLHAAVSSSSIAFVTPFSIPPVDPEPHTDPKKRMKGKKNGEVSGQPCPLSEPLSIEEKLHGSENLNKARKPSKYSKSKQKKGDVSNEMSLICSKSIKKNTRKGSKCKSFPAESSVLGIAELDCSEESMKVQNGLETCVLSGQGASNSQSEATLPANKTKGRKLPRSTKPVASKGRSNRAETSGRRRQNAHGKKEGNVRKSDNKCSSEDKSRTLDASLDASDGMSFSSGTVKPTLIMSTQLNSKTNAGSKVVPEDVSSSVMTPVGDKLALGESNHSLEGQSLPPQVAWVLCDDCEKWRCISVELANIIEETKCKWTCKDNTDKAFADCSIPQEKTDAAINAELGIPDEDDPSSVKPSSKGVEPSKLAASQRASWTSIKSNVFLHRNRKTQTIDEIMVCHCKRLRDGSLGCGDQCLNRMLNIECVKGTCPCGDLCSNQQFQKRKYAKFKWFRCGKKGYGLQLREDATRGQFLIEYVGEVLDLAAYEARQRYYASRGQKHFYFMTLNGGEVIDACAKGNLGRFINHSCDPNCRTEKWMVNGEVCIGLFAIRDIKKGEEVTFDYNYVRVVGAAAKKCVCGSSECRGYIGGDPLNSEVIVQGDSDEEDLEPVMFHEDVERELNVDETASDAIDDKVVKHEEISVQREDILIKCSPAILEPEVCLQIEDTVCRPLPDSNPLDIPVQTSDPIQSEDTMSRPVSDVQPIGDSKQSLNSIQTEETMGKPISEIQPLEIALQTSTTMNEVLSDSVLSSKKLIPNLVEEKLTTTKPYSFTKSSRSSGTIKKGRSTVKSLVSHKAKNLAAGTGSGQFEGVEGKLNELLDADGGISKQKDATKGYLKLLFVTAAEGDVRGCASQSTRDLSLILDAILKTKSRKVLVDVINKNGLQMLHNIMKQNRGNFNRIPIIRKLLKVLEFLALKGILSPEHINKDPPCSGMESFKESMLILTRHNDMQVHQIARNFRDKWIPRTIRRVEPSDRDGGQLDPQHSYNSWFRSSKLKCRHDQGARETDAIVISAAAHLPASSGELDIPGETSSLSQQVSISAPGTDNSSASGTRTRKRKSRWDQPSDITSPDPQSLSSIEDQTVEAGVKFMIPTSAQLERTSQLEVSKQTSGTQREGNSSSDEVASAKNPVQQNVDDEAPPGFGSPQNEHYSQVPSEISVATGEVVMGHLQERYLSHLTVSYGIPVALMEQLGTPETEGGSQCNPHWAIAPGMPFHPFPPLPSYPRGQPYPREERQQSHAASRTDLTIPSTSGGPADMVETGCRNSQFNGRVRWPSNGPGRRFIRPQRWNNRRFQRRWPSLPQQSNGCGFRGSLRDGASNLLVDNVRRDIKGGFCPPEGVSNDDVSSNFHQQSHHY